jgi:hypothetical protein
MISKSLQEQWLLDLMITDPAPVSWLLPVFRPEHANTLAISGFQPEDYAELILRCAKQGLIELFEAKRIVPPNERLMAVLLQRGQRPRTHMRITHSGGVAWEQKARPRWNRYVKSEQIFGGPTGKKVQRGVIATLNADLLVAWLGWYKSFEDEHIVWQTLRCKTIPSYNLVYWKTMKDVVVATFDWSAPDDDGPIVPPCVASWRRDLMNWYTPASTIASLADS